MRRFFSRRWGERTLFFIVSKQMTQSLQNQKGASASAPDTVCAPGKGCGNDSRFRGKGIISTYSISVNKSSSTMQKDGDFWFCYGYRKLNAVTRKDNYPLSSIDDTLLTLRHKCYFTTMDVWAGYFQAEMELYFVEKTAFCIPCGPYLERYCSSFK